MKTIKQIGLLLLAGVMAMTNVSCGPQLTDSNVSLTSSGETDTSQVSSEVKLPDGVSSLFKINNEVISNLSYGIGWNYYPHQVNPTGKDFETYMDLFEWTDPDYVRMATSMGFWNPQKNDYKKLNDNRLSGLMKFTDQFEKRKIPYMIANWKNGIPWLAEFNKGNDKVAEKNDWFTSGPADAEAFADVYANLLSYFIKEKNYKYLKGFSLWNEPEWGKPTYYSEKYKWPDGFLSMYPVFDKKFKEYGIRDQIEIVGVDGSGFLNKRHLKPEQMITADKFATLTQKVPDVVSIHDYEYYSDYNPINAVGNTITQGVNDIQKLKKDLKSAYGKDVPIIIGEYGNFGKGSANKDMTPSEQYAGSLSIAELVIRYTNAGVNGFCEWAFTSQQDDYVTNPIISDDEYLFRVNPPVYYMNAILSRYVKAKSDVYNTVLLKDADDATGVHHVYAAFMKLPDGNYTLNAVNSSPQDKTVSFDVSEIEGLDSKALNHLFIVGPYAEDGILRGFKPKIENGVLTVELKGRSVNSITTCEPGDLSLPAKSAVKRENFKPHPTNFIGSNPFNLTIKKATELEAESGKLPAINDNDTLQKAFADGQVSISAKDWIESVGNPDWILKKSTGAWEDCVLTPSDNVISGTIDLKLGDKYTGSRTIKDINMFVGLAGDGRSNYNIELQYSTRSAPNSFKTIASFGEYNGVTNVAKTCISLAGFNGQIKDVDTLRIVSYGAFLEERNQSVGTRIYQFDVNME